MEPPELESTLSKKLEYWFLLLRSKKTSAASKVAHDAVLTCRSFLNRGLGDSDGRSKALILGTLFHGLLEYCELVSLTIILQNLPEEKLIEKWWTKIHNCKDRIQFASGYVKHPVIPYVQNQLSSWLETFHQEFGPGLYSSPAFLIDREKCSICAMDFRACDHLPGRVYSGAVCYAIPEGIREARHVGLVKHAADPRCRIWPWRMKDDRTFECTILVSFRVDSFTEDLEFDSGAATSVLK